MYVLIYGLLGAAILSKCGAYSRFSLFITFFEHLVEDTGILQGYINVYKMYNR